MPCKRSVATTKIEWAERAWNPVSFLDLSDAALLIPPKRRKPTTYFVNSMSDVFHDGVPFEFIDKIMAVIALCPQHRFIILTKRPKRMREYFGDNKQRGRDHPAVRVGEETAIYVHCWSDDDKEELEHRLENWPLPNLILGVSVHDQKSADEFIPELLATPAACRAVSYEPALGPIVLPRAFICRSCQKIWSWPRPVSRMNPSCPKCDAVYSCRHAIDWLIAGGESGPGARPAHPDWFRSARDQCAAAGIPFFFTSWGEWHSGGDGLRDASWDRKISRGVCPCGSNFDCASAQLGTHRLNDRCALTALLMYRVGKKRAGRLLDGREHNELPEILRRC